MAVEVTFEDQTNKLKEILHKLENLIPSTKTSKGENLHLFGPHNLFYEQSNVNEIITSLKNKYEKFRNISNTSTVMKLVTDKKVLTGLSSPVNKCLKESISKIRDASTDSTLKTTIQKLEAISHEEGLRFDCEQMNNNCFISSDMFYVEVILDSTGLASDVKLHGHTGEPKSCKELINILRNKKYNEFRAHLKGLKERYLLRGDTFTKSKILSSLEALEEDVIKMQKSDPSCQTVSEYISRGPVGHVIPRVGGKNLQMTYCVDPLILLDENSQGTTKVYSNEDPFPTNIGYSLQLLARQSDMTFLPLSSLVDNEGSRLCYKNQDTSNSQELPATFILNLSKPMPASTHIAKCLYKILNKGDVFLHSSSASLDDLICQQIMNRSCSDLGEEELVTVLHDQTHLFRCVPCENLQNPGVLLSLVPFNHPVQIPHIVKLLRCQAIYNTLLHSCLNNDIQDKGKNTKKYVLDVSACDWNIISVTFIHPTDDSVASVDFVVSTEAIVECCLNVTSGSPVFCTNAYLSKIVNRCLSLPITMRSVFRKAESFKPDLLIAKHQPKDKLFPRPMKLLMPSLAQIQSGLTLSPHQLTGSPSAFLNFSSATASPSGSLFPTEKPKRSRKHSYSSTNSTPVGTPNSDGSSTPSKLKLKLKIKRKKNENTEIYEIDQPKTEFEIPENIPQQTPTDPHTFLPDFDTDLKTSQSMFPSSSTFPDIQMQMEGETDIAGLLGIPTEPFVQSDIEYSGSSHIPAFDLEALTSGGDLNLDSVSASVIDPSALTTQTSFDIEAEGMIDIDSLMNAVQ